MAVRIGVIGCGYWGSKVARDVADTPGAELTFISDVDPSRLADVAWDHPDARRSIDAAALVASDQVDAVMIVTPLRSHFGLARAALQAGKHVYVEKLLGETAEEAGELARLAAAHDRVLWVGHTVLHDPPVARLRRLVESGAVGRLRAFRAVRTSLGPSTRERGVLWDLVPHDLSLLLRLAGGAPASVRARGDGSPVGTVEVELAFDDGLVAELRASWDEPVRTREIVVETEAATLRYEPLRAPGILHVSHRSGAKLPALEAVSGPAGDGGSAPADADGSGPDGAPPLLRLVGAFSECCAASGCPDTGAGIGVQVLQVLAACEDSLAADGAPQPVAGARETPSRRAGARR